MFIPSLFVGRFVFRGPCKMYDLTRDMKDVRLYCFWLFIHHRHHYKLSERNLHMGAAGMGKGGEQLPPSGNIVKCFCALVVTVKRSLDEIFMHIFTTCHWGTCPQTCNLPTPGKNPAGADPYIQISNSRIPLN